MSGRLIRVVVAGALLTGAVLVSWAGASVAAGPANTQISGVGTYDGTSAEPGACPTTTFSLFTIKMEGSLEGCWYTPEFEVVQETPSGIYQERGAEKFVGCLNSVSGLVGCGSFETTYKFTAKFGPDGEIHGRCQHPIVAGSGTGVFEGATGRVDFKDDVVNECFNYRGHIKIKVT